VTTDFAKPGTIPARAATIFGILALVGAAAFSAGLATDADRAYRVFLHNWLLWAALSQGALVLSAAFRLTHAGWQGPIHRLVDSLGAFVPLSLVLYAVIFVGRHHIFHWIHDPGHVAGKEWWLNEGFFFGRDLFVLVWMTFVSLLYYYISLRPVLGRAREGATGWQRSLVGIWTAGWRGDEREEKVAERRGQKIAAILALSFALCYSLLGIDLVMSLAPHWISTMFPAYYSWGGFLSAVSLTTLLVVRTVASRCDHAQAPSRHGEDDLRLLHLLDVSLLVAVPGDLVREHSRGDRLRRRAAGIAVHPGHLVPEGVLDARG
jgi:hypothetical protein